MDTVILIDKPEGFSSHETVGLVKKRLGVKKAGHTGTLDPVATGLLIVCTGEATKIGRFLTDLPKRYEAILKVGERTETFDSEGEVTERGPVPADAKPLLEALSPFRGRIRQVPPMYSALKVSGTPLYRLARQGVQVAREEREVEISELELLGYTPPFAKLLIACSKGTYIRALADDIGLAAGSFAHITGLRRLAIGPFDVRDSASPEDFDEAKPAAFFTIDQALGFFLEELSIGGEDLRRASNGAPFRTNLPIAGSVRIKDPEGKLLGIGTALKGLVRVERLLRLSS
ncbi:MAG: tRNA pseudouridine(55) synthase TruB [Nitrospiraceae bacterium]|nr:tRNA pseudouridine(55) synthase TruB [Nitrospiraceae bacterium]